MLHLAIVLVFSMAFEKSLESSCFSFMHLNISSEYSAYQCPMGLVQSGLGVDHRELEED